MKTEYEPSLKATVTLDDAGRIRGINHLDEYREMEGFSGRDAVTAYVRDIAGKLNIAPETLRGMEQPVSYLDPREAGVEFRFTEEKAMFDGVTYAYYQTYLNTPVWAAGVSVTTKQAPTRVVAATNTSEQGINAKLPDGKAIGRYRRLFATGEKFDGRREAAPIRAAAAAAAEDGLLADIFGKSIPPTKAAAKQEATPRLVRGRFFIYRYDAAKRTEDFPRQPPATNQPRDGAEASEPPLAGSPPTLPLPAVPNSIKPGNWYLVAELIIRVPDRVHMRNWRLLVEVESNAILYLRALTSGVDGQVFLRDPTTATGIAANSPAATAATLNPLRNTVTLPGLTAPAPGANQALTGNFIQISDFELATAAPPTEPSGINFNYGTRTNNFAAVNAYYHCDRFFRLVENLGFTIATYFNGTTFPVPVDHRGRFLTTDGIEVNASCNGDGDGIANVDFELADLGDTANPLGIAADWRVVLHELGGHGILYDHVNTANFGFAHSAGDSFAVILNDAETLAPDRFVSFPWITASRRHDRAVAAGWGWGGTQDTGGYNSEQILATTMFRAYRSIGGDSSSLGRRQFAARCMAYLMLRAIGTLTPVSNPGSPAQFLAALLLADAENWTSEGIFGGAYGKVLTWSFEEQNLNSGVPPSVDVYIEDGRAGEYQFQAVHWATTTIWNRRNLDGMTTHEEPALLDSMGMPATNYAYVRIKNRGTSIANNVIVRGYHCRPSAGVLWPNDLQPMTTPELPAGTLQPNNAEEKIVGPFEWTPALNAWGHDCMMMIVSSTGDPSNVDNFTAGEVVEDWRLVPNDNNVGQRNVNVVPGGGGLQGLIAGMHGKGFWAGNPGRKAATITASIDLPPWLARRGWRISLLGIPEGGIRLKSREQRLVTFDVHAGAEFSKDDVVAAAEPDIVVTARADGAVIGGMTYKVDPNIQMPYNELTPEQKKAQCRDRARQLLECLDLPGNKVKCVRVRKIAIDVELKGNDDCCD